MTRSTLWLAVLLTMAGCDRQVSLDDSASGGAGVAVIPAANAPVDANVPIELPDPMLPVVSDSGSLQTEAPAVPATEPVNGPEDVPADVSVDVPAIVEEIDDEASDTTAVSNRSVGVRLDEPELLRASAGLVEFTPALINTDGSRIALACCDANDAWMADVPLDSDGQWEGTVQWSTVLGGANVIVLAADVQVLEPDADVVDISPPSYDRSIDSDGDGIGNFTEVIAGTNPLNAGDVSEDFLEARVRIPRVSPNEVPTIDGRAGNYEPNLTRFSGEWAAAVHVDIDGDRLSIDNLMHSMPGFATQPENHHWLALHDGTWLYLLVVIDDAGMHHFDSREVAKSWRDDGIEIFIDGDNSQTQSYDQVDDFSMHVLTLNSNASGSNSSTDANPNVFRSVNSVPLPAGLVFSTGPLQGPSAPAEFASSGTNQDVYEIALRISDLNIELGRTFGFEVQFNDDDDAGDRDAKWGWVHPAGNSTENDFTWRDPSFMGRVVLLP